MEKLLTINIISHQRDFFDTFFHSFQGMKKENKDKIVINILSSGLIERDLDKEPKDIEVRYKNFGICYMPKIKYAIQADTKYSVKIDEDIFTTSHIWDYLVENLHLLDNEDNLLITPLLSTGIPTVDIYNEQFYEKKDREIIEEVFANKKIPSLWGANYETLNKHYENKKWDSQQYYESVSKINHFYRGIHPIRVSLEAQRLITELTIKNLDKFLDKHEYSIKSVKFPYFCNSFFAIRTDIWKKIINDKSLFKDQYDEVPLNLYMRNNNKNMLLINNAFSLHPSYNTIGGEYGKLSKDVFGALKSKLNL